MLALLAQGPSASPAEIGTWLLVFALIASIVGNVAGVLRGNRTKTEISPQPVEVKLAEKFVTREACKIHEQRIESVERRVERLESSLLDSISEIREVISKGQAMDEERARRLHQRIDLLATNLSEKIGTLHGQLNPPNQRRS